MTKEKVKATEPEVSPPTKRTGPKSILAAATVWQTLLKNVGGHLTEMPHLAAEHSELERLVSRILGSLAEQNNLKKEISKLVRARTVDVELARESQRRLTALIKGRFGSTSEELHGFGLKPRKRNRTRKQIEGTPQEPAPENPAPEPAVVKIE